MTDRPIIFSAPMVRALLDGRKTQTRRIIRGTRADALSRGFVGIRLPCAPGDQLWVREVWGLGLSDHGDCPHYRATMDYRCGDKIKSEHEGPFRFRWRSPIHMPRWASRITLTVTDVRVQRLQEISEADAEAEGVTPTWPDGTPIRHDGSGAVCREAFRNLWNDIHGPGAWEKNPWVAALTFTVQHRNIDQ